MTTIESFETLLPEAMRWMNLNETSQEQLDSFVRFIGDTFVLTHCSGQDRQFKPSQIESPLRGKCPPSISLSEFLVRLVGYQNKWADAQEKHIERKTGLRKNDSLDSLHSDSSFGMFREKLFFGRETMDAEDEEPEAKVNTGMRSLMVALVYINRVLKNIDFKVEVENVHRLFSASMLCAAKFGEDSMFSNKFWCQVSGIALNEMNLIELEFVKLIRFDLFIKPEDFQLALMGAMINFKNYQIQTAQRQQKGALLCQDYSASLETQFKHPTQTRALSYSHYVRQQE